MTKLADRRPWSSGADDKYVSRFIARSLRMMTKQGLTHDQWFAKLPPNLSNSFYYFRTRNLSP